MPSLTELAAQLDLPIMFDAAFATQKVTSLAVDSRMVKKGALFIALRGVRANGLAYVPEAIERGAVAVLCAQGDAPAVPQDVAVVHTPDMRVAVAKLAALFFPQQPKHIAAITGTDGKTSTAEFTRQLLKASGHPAVSIGTLGLKGAPDASAFPAINTTPDPLLLHHMLHMLKEQGVDYAAMEASSHGLDQHRLDGVHIQAAAFTNLARDHMDYHQTEEAYFAAKSRLFGELLAVGGTAVLNADDAHFDALKKLCGTRGGIVLDYGKAAAALQLLAATPTAHGQHVEFAVHGKHYQAEVPLVGDFQVMNILAALGLCMGFGLAAQDVVPFIPLLRGVHGRLEKVAAHSNGAPVFIDYAHTPAALEKILTTLRPHVMGGRLVLVFGCGGDRDKGKRPQMGKVAADCADIVYVTDDNPRSEVPATIRTEILAACPDAVEIGDRREAIFAAAQQLRAGDLLVIAGKGHETTQIYNDAIMPFDDGEVAREAVGTK